jgi:hypothetical protein
MAIAANRLPVATARDPKAPIRLGKMTAANVNKIASNKKNNNKMMMPK